MEFSMQVESNMEEISGPSSLLIDLGILFLLFLAQYVDHCKIRSHAAAILDKTGGTCHFNYHSATALNNILT